MARLPCFACSFRPQRFWRCAARFLVLALPAVAAAAGEVWRPFSDDSPWNQPIAADATPDPASEALIADFASRGPLHINIRDWSIPVYFVDAATTPKHAVFDSRPGIFGRGFEFPRAIPIPDGAVASPPVGEESDNHLCIIDRRLGLEWGLWAARRNAQGEWGTGLGAVTDLRGTGVAPPWFAAARELDAHRARASGFPLIAGLIRVEEIRAGRIAHALCFAYDHCRGGFFVPPASTAQVTMQDMSARTGIPMGGRIQLDPAWDVDGSALSPNGRSIARALQEFGAYCGDFAGANVIYAENSPVDTEELYAVFTPDFIRTHFRVLDMGNVLPGQNCPVAGPYLTELRETSTGRTARIDYFSHTARLTLPASLDAGDLTLAVDVFPRTSRVMLNGEIQPGDTVRHRDFSSAVLCQVEAPNGDRSEWIVLVAREP
jgi:hypothetical protein